MNAHLSLSSTILVTPRRAGLRVGQDNTVKVLVRIQAPGTPAGHAAERPPQALALVIDRSGSMQGRPLDEARPCAEYVIGKLRPTDCVSLLQLDNRVQCLWPAAPLGDGTALRSVLGGITAGGNTNLHGGWQEGALTLAGVAGNALKRVILLSDGQANDGETDSAAIAAQCADWAARGVGTSTYGLGRGFNEELLVAMARSGGGNHYYGDTAEDLMEPFEQELELLENLCLRELTLSIDAADGVQVEMINPFVRIDGGWRLPDLAWGAEAWAVLRLKVGEFVLPAAGNLLSLLRVTVTGKSLAGEPVQLECAGLALPALSPAAFDNLEGDELVARRMTELAAAEALSQMWAAAAVHDWARVDRLLQEATRQFAGNDWVAAMLASMQQIAEDRSRERLMKERRIRRASCAIGSPQATKPTRTSCRRSSPRCRATCAGSPRRARAMHEPWRHERALQAHRPQGAGHRSAAVPARHCGRHSWHFALEPGLVSRTRAGARARPGSGRARQVQ